MSTPIRPTRLTAAAEAIRSAGSSDVTVLSSSEAGPLPSRSAALLRTDTAVGAIVPGAGGGHLRADVRVAPGPAVALAPGVLRGLRIDPDVDDGFVVAQAAIDHVRARGQRVLADPMWTGASAGSAETDSTLDGTDVLVVTGYLDDEPSATEDRSAFELIRSLRDQMVSGRITVLLTDRFRSGRQIDRLVANGVEVVAPPVDRDRWLAEQAGRFSHAVITSSGLQSLSWSGLARTQPQAARILFLSSLAFREVSALGPLTPVAEQASLESVRAAVEAKVLEMARQAEAVWCEAEADARWARGCLPGTPVHVAAPAMDVPEPEGSPAGRRGVIVVGDIGHDLVAANEDAAAMALDNLVPALRRALPDLEFRVVTDQPSPFLREVMARHDAQAVPTGRAADAVASSRLLVDLHTYGTGGEAALRLALQEGTPFVAHVAAPGRLDLGPLAGMALFGAPADLAFRARALLEDDHRWLNFRRAADALLRRSFDPAVRAGALRAAAAPMGVELTLTGGAWIDDEPPKDDRRPYNKVRLPLRVGRTVPARRRRGELPSPWDHDLRYQMWEQANGPSADVVAALRSAVADLPYQPTISVLVPVYNTPSAILRETIDSVINQSYGHWQLCLADDRSTDRQTLAVLAEVEQLPGVEVVRLAGNSGISGATNAALAVATGDYVAFLDHDDLLKPHALAQVVRWLNADPEIDYVYSDEDKIDEAGDLVQPHIKPDWSPNMIMSQNYVCHLSVVRRSLVEELGGLRSSFDGSQDHDLVLRVAERTDRIAHIPEPLYSWRIMAGSTSAGVDAKPYAADAARRALREALVRRGQSGTVANASIQGMYRTGYALPGTPRVAIVIPTKGSLHLLEPCIRSIYQRSTYPNFEVVVIDNQTTDGPTLEYLANFPGRVIRYDHVFNYARMMNLAARTVGCDAFLFLNNDTEVITPTWIEELLSHAMRPEVGAVGGRLYFGDGRVQHEGIVVGLGGWANNIDHQGYWGRGDIVRDTTAVTGACTMIRSSVYWRIGGNDERLRVAYNDVDICMRIRQAGYQVVYTPYAELYHHEGSSRSGMEHHEDGPQFGIRWRPEEGVDPFFSPTFQKVMPPFVIGL